MNINIEDFGYDEQKGVGIICVNGVIYTHQSQSVTKLNELLAEFEALKGKFKKAYTPAALEHKIQANGLVEEHLKHLDKDNHFGYGGYIIRKVSAHLCVAENANMVVIEPANPDQKKDVYEKAM